MGWESPDSEACGAFPFSGDLDVLDTNIFNVVMKSEPLDDCDLGIYPSNSLPEEVVRWLPPPFSPPKQVPSYGLNLGDKFSDLFTDSFSLSPDPAEADHPEKLNVLSSFAMSLLNPNEDPSLFLNSKEASGLGGSRCDGALSPGGASSPCGALSPGGSGSSDFSASSPGSSDCDRNDIERMVEVNDLIDLFSLDSDDQLTDRLYNHCMKYESRVVIDEDLDIKPLICQDFGDVAEPSTEESLPDTKPLKVEWEARPSGPYNVTEEHSYFSIGPCVAAASSKSSASSIASVPKKGQIHTATIHLKNRGRVWNVQSENVPPQDGYYGRPRRVTSQAKGKAQKKATPVSEPPRRGRRPGTTSTSDRLTHNKMERTRRKEQRTALVNLRREIPHLRTQEKAPKVRVLEESAKYVMQLQTETRALESRSARLNELCKKLQKRLKNLIKGFAKTDE